MWNEVQSGQHYKGTISRVHNAALYIVANRHSEKGIAYCIIDPFYWGYGIFGAASVACSRIVMRQDARCEFGFKLPFYDGQQR